MAILTESELRLFTADTRPLTQGISVVIPYKDRPTSLLPCVEHIRTQGYPCEIIVVEETTECTVDIPDITYVRVEPAGQFFNKSRCINAGVAAAKYEHICLNDADIIMQRGYLHTINTILKIHETGNVARQIYYLTNVPSPSILPEYEWKWTDRNPDRCSGGNVFWRKSAFVRIGGMNEAFEGYGAEDAEFHHRAIKLSNFFDIRTMSLLHIPHPPQYGPGTNVKLWKAMMALPIAQLLGKLRSDLAKHGLK